MYFSVTLNRGEYWTNNRISVIFGDHSREFELPFNIIDSPNLKDYDNEEYVSYGFTYSDGSISIYYGQQSFNSEKSKSKHIDIPWLTYEFRQYNYYDLKNNILYSGNYDLDQMKQVERIVPKLKVKFNDSEDKEIEATLFVKEMVWNRGTGMFKWLGNIFKPRTYKFIDITFNKETSIMLNGHLRSGILQTSHELLFDKQSPEWTFALFAEEYGFSNLEYSNGF